MKPTKRGIPQHQILLKHGVRSGLEEAICDSLQKRGVAYEYETLKLKYTQPAKQRTYTPDILLPNGIVIELKGRFLSEDRAKHLLIKAQYPDMDLRFVFSNSKTKISKRSPTTYAMWAEKNGFLYADKEIPDAWLKEN
jgi:hypothetical protein